MEAMLALAVLAGTWLITQCRPRANHHSKPAQAVEANAGFGESSSLSRGNRVNYRFSVIARGAYSDAELQEARRSDPVVAAHYASFGGNTVVEPVDRDLYMFVSYRKLERVYWTKERHRIPKGELILNDGKQMARARCGNRLSAAPQYPTGGADEPAEAAFDLPPALERLPEPKLDVPELTDFSLYAPALPMAEGPEAPAFVERPKAAISGASSSPYEPLPLPQNASASSYVGGIPVRAPVIPSGGGGAASPVGPTPGPVVPLTGLETPEPPTPGLLSLGLIFAVLAIALLQEHKRRSG